MLKLILAGVACLASSSKYYYDKVIDGHDKEFSVMSLADAKENKRHADESHVIRIEAWLKIVFQDKHIPLLETVETTDIGKHRTTWMLAMPVGKEYAQAVSDSDAEFITHLDRLYTENSEYSKKLENALRFYLEKRSEYTGNLITRHLKKCPDSLVMFYYDHTSKGGETVEAMLDINGSFNRINLGFCPDFEDSLLADKHGYLADIFVKLSRKADDAETLKCYAEKLAQEDFDKQAGVILHEIGHIVNKDDQQRRIIKKNLPPLTTVLGLTALVASQSKIPSVLSTGLCLSSMLAAALALPCLSFHSKGPNLATWLCAYSGEYRADSYALQYATIRQLMHFREVFERDQDVPQDWFDEHPATTTRIKLIEKQIKKLEALR